MSGNSIEDIVAAMQGRPMTYGWGAIAAFNRSKLNRMLDEQFAARLSRGTYLPPISGEFDLVPGSVKSRFDSIMFGPPRLSFQSASQTESAVTLTLEVVSGDYTVTSRSVEGVPQLISSSRIAEGMSFTLEMDVDLTSVIGEVDGRGRVSIDLSKGENPRCNLAPELASQELLGQFLLAQLKEQPAFRRNWELGLLDLTTTGLLSPTHFAIRTQAAPGGDDARSESWGDGAILFFVALKGLQGEPTSFPTDLVYLIPGDQGSDGPLYSAALVLSEKLIQSADEEQLNSLKSLILPADYFFTDEVRRQPHDLVLFGNIEPTHSNVTITPLLTSVKNAQRKQFTVQRGDGGAIPDVAWEVSCINVPLAAGSIDATGTYSAAEQSVLGKNVLPTIVTARFTHDGSERVESAMVFARFEGINVAPIAATRAMGGAAIPLAASGVGGEGLEWCLLEPALGVLEVIDSNHARYLPPADLGGQPIVVQRIEVRDTATGEAVEASIILIGEQLYVPVEPPHISSILGRGAVPFQVPEHFSPYCKWSVLGDGEIEAGTGVFSPPLTLSSSPVSVVICEAVIGEATLRGLAVIELAERQQEIKGWTGLHEFSIRPLGPVEAYANGMQQIAIEVKITTTTPNPGEPHVPISDLELASLRLVEKTTGAEVAVLEGYEEGIEADSDEDWAMHDRQNRFRLFNGARARALAEPESAGTRYRKLFIHLAHRGDEVEFYAQFQDESGTIWRSLDLGQDATKTIRVRGHSVPSTGESNYEFVRKRIWNNLETGRIEGDDEFSYMLESTDVWSVLYKRDGLYPTGFSTLRFKEGGNTSTIQWESDLLDETFFSYTGYAFNPVRDPEKTAVPDTFSFDPYLGSLMNSVSHAPPDPDMRDHSISVGTLAVSVHRLADMSYWYDRMSNGDRHKLFRQMLDGPVLYILRDEDGNPHNLEIGFLPITVENSRNNLEITIRADGGL